MPIRGPVSATVATIIVPARPPRREYHSRSHEPRLLHRIYGHPPAPGAHDLHRVSVANAGARPLAAGHDLAVEGHRHLRGDYVERLQQGGDAQRALKLPRLAVDSDGDHSQPPARRMRWAG